ncbi:MAG: class I SAM-dependent methyltransferase [Betaproteobacteria bacterium]
MRVDPRSTAASLPTPSVDAAAHSARLVQHIAQQIAAAGGWIGFDRYMDLALYAPGLGYYTAGARKFGDSSTGGDFVTAPEISPLFADALAAQVAQVVQMLEQRAARVLEFGAGSGALARDLLAALGARGIEVERYEIVEVSAELRDRQRARLAHTPVVRWLDAPPRQFEGVIVANEVLDVLPVQLFVGGADGVLERGVAWRGDRFVFEDRPAGAALRDAVVGIEADLGVLPAGYCSEMGLIARAWTASLAGVLARGVALLIDYGFPRREYYHPQRSMGTIMCHYRHHAHADPFWLPGLTDITAHVDFTAVADAAHAAGLDVLGYTTQAHFLLNCGLLHAAQAATGTARHAAAAAAQRLVSEAEMGELFKVLAVGRGIEWRPALLGVAAGDRLHTL